MITSFPNIIANLKGWNKVIKLMLEERNEIMQVIFAVSNTYPHLLYFKQKKKKTCAR